jgi:hypothetical protein
MKFICISSYAINYARCCGISEPSTSESHGCGSVGPFMGTPAALKNGSFSKLSENTKKNE